MPRETKEQRMESKRLEQERQNVENVEFLAALPMTVFRLMARVQKRYDVSTTVSDTDGQLCVKFCFDAGAVTPYATEAKVFLRTNYEWEMQDAVDEVTRRLDELNAADAEAARLRNVAQNAYDSLSDEQRAALGLTRRP